MAIEKGKKVKIEYEGSLENGEVFDSSEKHGKPLEFTVGENQVIPGFENQVIGMEKGQEKTIKISPEEAYGEKKPELVQKIPKTQVPAEQASKIQKGMVLGLNAPDGRQVPVMVTDVDDEGITLDMNHPLAGKTLNFKIKVVDVE